MSRNILHVADVLRVAYPAIDNPGDLTVINTIGGGVLVQATDFVNRMRTQNALDAAGYRTVSQGARVFIVEPARGSHLRRIK